jgi:hypothetical protein
MENTKIKQNIWRKVIKLSLRGLFFLVMLTFIAQLIWKMSGSNQWELIKEENGHKIYTLKAPGSSIIKVKGTTRVKSSLNGIIALSLDQSTCADSGCLKAEVFEQSSEELSYVQFAFPLPYGLENRDFVVKSLYAQNPVTKEIVFDFTSVPGKLPADDGFFRVTHFYVFWRFTPLGNGEVDVEMVRDIDTGGYAPAYMVNDWMISGGYWLMETLQEALDKEKYLNANVSFIEELEIQETESEELNSD